MPRDLFDLMGGDDAEPQRVNDSEDVKSCDLDLVLHYDTGKAVLVSEDGEEAKAVWIPKAQLEIHTTAKQIASITKRGQRELLPMITITMPVWLAKNKGLV